MNPFYALGSIEVGQWLIYFALIATAPYDIINIIGPMCIVGQVVTAIVLIFLAFKIKKNIHHFNTNW